MASIQASDSHSNIEISPSNSVTPANAQEGNEGSSRTRYSRKAKKESSDVGKVEEDEQDAKEVTKVRGKSKSKKAKIDARAEVEEKKEDVVTGLNLPLDIWILIAEQADPVSLLQLTRINKTLRNLLTSKRTSKAIWKKHIDRLKLPKLEHQDGRDIAFISFIFEDMCAHCGEHETDKEDWNLRLKWHGKTCEKKLLVKTSKLAKKLHSETRNCVAVTIKNKQHLQSEIASVNTRLSDESDPVKQTRMIRTLKGQVAEIKNDGLALSHWYTRSLESRDRNLYDRLGQTYYAVDIMEMSKIFNLDPIPLTDTEWSKIAAAYSQAIDEVVTNRDEGQRRDSLTNNYRSLKYELSPGQFEVFPPFATFLELPSIKLLWVPAPRSGAHWFYTKYRYPSAPISHIHEKWRTALPSIKSEIVMAICWYKIGYARIMADSLQASSRPLPASLLSALNPPGTSTPASWETLELGTIDYDDSSRIPTKALDELLDRYSTQAWYGGKGQMPGHFSHHLPSEQINQFPRFHPYWHNVLLQALEVADFSDGPVGETAVRLDALGEKFFCGQCSTLENGVRLSALLRHLQTHPIPNSNKLPKQLIIYKDPNASSPSAPQISSSAIPQATASSTNKRASKAKGKK